jgi:4-hydroxyacetophenone monooxygenase
MIVADEALVSSVRHAYLPALLVALAHASGDLSLLRDDLRPDPSRIVEPQSGLSPEQRAAARDLAVDALRRLLERHHVEPPASDEATLRRLFEFLVGEPVSDDYLLMLEEELGLSGVDRRTPTWRVADIAPNRTFRVVIIGAGMSGLVAAHRLGQAGVECTVIEKNDDVGGTWFENRYPGCRVDVPNHLYSYSFFQRDDWPDRFTLQGGLLDYFRACADRFGLRDRIRFGTEVVSATFRDATADWELSLRGPGSRSHTLVVDAVVSAVGQLNRPRIPDLPGRDAFAGQSFHSAAWARSVDLAGRRVAVIGTGASAIQLVPAIAPDVAELHVYQRTPNWLMPTPDYHAPTSVDAQWLLRAVPIYSEWYRLSLFWRLAEGALPAARVDDQWTGDPRSVGPRSDELRVLLTRYIESQFASHPDLLAHVVPQYPPLAKRILLDDGIWAATLTRDNVQLVTDPIECITETGVVAGGRQRDVDVIVYATGFDASRFLMPMRVTGRDGVDLHEHWAGDPRAYLGLTIPGFPNLFCLYGPNTNLVANGSIIFFSECAVQYVLGCVRLLLESRARALDCRRAVHDAYNAGVDEANSRMAWGAFSVNSWYRNSNGRITQNWPYTLLEYWQRTHAPDPDDFDLL